MDQSYWELFTKENLFSTSLCIDIYNSQIKTTISKSKKKQSNIQEQIYGVFYYYSNGEKEFLS